MVGVKKILGNAKIKNSTVKNFIYLYGVQFANYLLPLLTFPFLARVLQPRMFGALMISQVLSQYVFIIQDYGFNFTATREVAQHRQNPQKLGEIAGSVFGVKLLLILPSVLFMIIAYQIVPAIRGYPGLAMGALLLGIGLGFSPTWFFQGLEKMGAVAFLEILVRAIATIAIFAFVRGPEQVLIPLFAPALASFISSYIGFTMIVRYTGSITWSLRQSLRYLQHSFLMFFYGLITSLYTLINVILLNLYLPSSLVANFSGAERLVRTLINAWTPITRIFYPRFSLLLQNGHNDTRILALKAGILTTSLGVLTGFSVYMFSPWIISAFLGPDYVEAIGIMRVLSLILPLNAISSFLGIQWMLAHGMDRPFNLIIFSASIINVVLAVNIIPHFGLLGMAWISVTVESIIVISMIVYLYYVNRLPWSFFSRK